MYTVSGKDIGYNSILSRSSIIGRDVNNNAPDKGS